jgi:hypothetical protein
VQQLIGRPDTVIVARGLTVLIGIEMGWRAIHSKILHEEPGSICPI